jgi:hypothetical protein
MEMMLTMNEKAPDVKRVGMAFKPVNNAKQLHLDSEHIDERRMHIRSIFSLK